MRKQNRARARPVENRGKPPICLRQKRHEKRPAQKRQSLHRISHRASKNKSTHCFRTAQYKNPKADTINLPQNEAGKKQDFSIKF